MKIEENHLDMLFKAIFFLALIFVPCKTFASVANLTESETRVCREKIIAEAKKCIGSPYVLGATGPDAFDCSGLIYYVVNESIQLQLPRTAKTMYGYCKIIPPDVREPGDLVFFKTIADGSISHVGLYIGNLQFISAASDGTNNGVILSSLNENYWKTHYAASGKFLNDSGLYDNNKNNLSTEIAKASSSSSSKPSSSQSPQKTSSTSSNSSENNESNNSFVDNLALDVYTTFDWALFTEKRFMPNFRGISAGANLIYEMDNFSFAVGTILRWNYGVGAFQIPIPISVYCGDYVRIYAGPVFTIGTCTSPDTDDEIKGSIFPGIIGATFMAPSFTKGDLKVRIIQDINYSVFNNTDGAALSPLQTFSAGFVFSTGISVMFPLNGF